MFKGQHRKAKGSKKVTGILRDRVEFTNSGNSSRAIRYMRRKEFHSHKETQPGERFLTNVDLGEDIKTIIAEYAPGCTYRLGNTAYNTNNKIVPNSKPLFVSTKAKD